MKKNIVIKVILFSVIFGNSIIQEFSGVYTEGTYYITSDINTTGDIILYPGVKILVNPGVRINVDNYSFVILGSSDNPIEIQGVGGGEIVSWEGIFITNVLEELIIHNLIISNAQCAFTILNSEDVNIQRTNINSNNGIYIDNLSNFFSQDNTINSFQNAIDFNNVDHVTMISDTINSDQNGIGFYEGNVNWFEIHYSKIKNCSGYGIRLSNNNNFNTLIKNNTFDNNYKALQIDGNLYDFKFERNLISSKADDDFLSEIDSAYSNYGIHKLNGTFYNENINSINNNIFTGLMGSIVWSGEVENVNINNNIFHSNNFCIYNFESYEYSNVTNNLFYENQDNFFHNPSNGVGIVDGLNFNGDSSDINLNLYMDPLFVDPDNENYNIQSSSPCIDAGMILFENLDPDGTFSDIGINYFHQDDEQDHNDEDIILGCTDSCANNYNPSADIDDGSCDYNGVLGCTYAIANNYNPNADIDDGSCEFNYGDLTGDGIMNIIDIVIMVEYVLEN